MVKRFLRWAFDKSMDRQKEPWAMFEIAGFEEDGRIKVKFNWNTAFIKKAQELGFQAETEEDTVQLFFYASTMRPTDLSIGDDPVQSDAHPTLSGQQNTVMR